MLSPTVDSEASAKLVVADSAIKEETERSEVREVDQSGPREVFERLRFQIGYLLCSS